MTMQTTTDYNKIYQSQPLCEILGLWHSYSYSVSIFKWFDISDLALKLLILKYFATWITISQTNSE